MEALGRTLWNSLSFFFLGVVLLNVLMTHSFICLFVPIYYSLLYCVCIFSEVFFLFSFDILLDPLKAWRRPNAYHTSVNPALLPILRGPLAHAFCDGLV